MENHDGIGEMMEKDLEIHKINPHEPLRALGEPLPRKWITKKEAQFIFPDFKDILQSEGSERFIELSDGEKEHIQEDSESYGRFLCCNEKWKENMKTLPEIARNEVIRIMANRYVQAQRTMIEESIKKCIMEE